MYNVVHLLTTVVLYWLSSFYLIDFKSSKEDVG